MSLRLLSDWVVLLLLVECFLSGTYMSIP
jgi:hypothetical protein